MTETTSAQPSATPPPPNPAPRPSGPRAFFASRGWRFAMMIALTLLMGLPVLMIVALIEDRAHYQRKAVNEVSTRWGGPVRLAGPILVIPVEREVVQTVVDDDGTKRRERRRERTSPIVLLPETLDVDSQGTSQLRKRGIFEVPVFTSELKIEALFDTARIQNATSSTETILWDQARLAVLMPGKRSFSGRAILTANGRPVDLDPGTPLPTRTDTSPERTRSIKKADMSLEPGTPFSGVSGIQAAIGDPRGKTTFRLSMGLNGAREMMFTPLGRQTEVAVRSDWPHPSFQGDFLPKSRDIADTGFSATWSIPHLARDMAQVVRGKWRPSGYFGVSFYNPVDVYQKTSRAAKYGVLFIALTFLTVFLIERFAARPVHAAQFVLIGIAQCVFFLLLLSFAEQMGFTPAYVGSAAATIGLIGLYGWSGLALGRRALILIGCLVTLYSVLYLILRSTDFALLAGSILAFVAVALAMLMTRSEDWTSQSSRPATA